MRGSLVRLSATACTQADITHLLAGIRSNFVICTGNVYLGNSYVPWYTGGRTSPEAPEVRPNKQVSGHDGILIDHRTWIFRSHALLNVGKIHFRLYLAASADRDSQRISAVTIRSRISF